MTEEKKFTLTEAHKEFAKKTNGRIWKLLDQENRSQVENDELLYAAYASCYHWLKVGTGVHQQRGEYLIAKVYVSLNVPEQALHHAKRCLALTEQHQDEMKDFDIAFAYECVARAYAMNGDEAEAIKYYELAKKAGNEIKNAEDKKIFDNDLAGGNWFGIF
jgi:tetratricopeptide (TPR) repeat protein